MYEEETSEASQNHLSAQNTEPYKKKDHSEIDRTSEIARETMVLNDNINSLSAIIDILQKKLAAVLRIEPDAEREVQDVPPLVPLANYIHGKNYSIQELERQVRSMVQRLEL